ncbi:hypothetical protein ACELLULO517_15740 [Acidisoma cellulosilytica]|uniref:Uncharacterized protein n=1 Tax=Acidisoma cellulosilyticum TaxID=2802395 RepID=A0A964E4H5_9PROT|nr:hypothetical protein [Acidisoma cellulosilyticum]MCB8881700.1 hypothetical protein [Acidisoma cellulosilyticum]
MARIEYALERKITDRDISGGGYHIVSIELTAKQAMRDKFVEWIDSNKTKLG